MRTDLSAVKRTKRTRSTRKVRRDWAGGKRGDGHRLQFSTVGEGYLGPSAHPGVQHGTVMWRVEGGTGQFDGAQGLITSNFTVGAEGEVVDHHLGLLWVR